MVNSILTMGGWFSLASAASRGWRSATSRGTGRMAAVLAVIVTATLTAGAGRAEENDVDKARGYLRQAAGALRGAKYDEAGSLAQQASQAAPTDAGVQQRAGELLFLSGKLEESLPRFDRANELDPTLAPHNWQRGVALGCAGKFAAGAEQFRVHHEVNPDDVENSAWYFLCVAKTKGKAAAQSAIIPSRGDARQPMMSVLKMLRGTLAPDEVLVAAKANTKEGAERKTAMFYGFLYVALYYDSIGEDEKAVSAMDRCVALANPDYMGRTAQIYREHRFKNIPAGSPKESPTSE